MISFLIIDQPVSDHESDIQSEHHLWNQEVVGISDDEVVHCSGLKLLSFYENDPSKYYSFHS